jgi:outer membrane protein OmpA-like peptidoglycan-associated protein
MRRSFCEPSSETGSPNASADAEPMLNGVPESLREVPHGKRVSIVGHIDARGSPEANVQLSQRRAEALRDYTTSRRVSSDMLRL